MLLKLILNVCYSFTSKSSNIYDNKHSCLHAKVRGASYEYSYHRMHGVFAHSNLERLAVDSIGFSVLKRALIYLVIVSVRGNPVCAETPCIRVVPAGRHYP